MIGFNFSAMAIPLIISSDATGSVTRRNSTDWKESTVPLFRSELGTKRAFMERRYPTSVDRYVSTGGRRKPGGRLVGRADMVLWIVASRGSVQPHSPRAGIFDFDRQTRVFWAQVNKDSSQRRQRSDSRAGGSGNNSHLGTDTQSRQSKTGRLQPTVLVAR